ncbi:hypothetical protein TRIUR3_08236 [Triticum urartu]|uniref:Uncharacterized protein n=1 Tax=Triticum urartu TaxID=4572 RepID=M7Z753_TRIUA|nr:hypothetical protein TRIUR3_08236 [Triticum urartu]
MRGVQVATIGDEGTDAHCAIRWGVGGTAAAMAPRVFFSQLKKATGDDGDRGQRRALAVGVGGGNEPVDLYMLDYKSSDNLDMKELTDAATPKRPQPESTC